MEASWPNAKLAEMATTGAPHQSRGRLRAHLDNLECAAHRLAPRCQHCSCAIIGHGVETNGPCSVVGTALGTRLPDRVPAPWPLSGADIAARTGPTALQRATDDADVQVVDEQGDSGSARGPAVLRHVREPP